MQTVKFLGQYKYIPVAVFKEFNGLAFVHELEVCVCRLLMESSVVGNCFLKPSRNVVSGPSYFHLARVPSLPTYLRGSL